MHILRNITTAAIVLIAMAAVAFSQRSAKLVLFAVHSDGEVLEPIAFVAKGKLVEIGAEGGDAAAKRFATAYYRKGHSYDLIFGGGVAGKVSVESAMYPVECAGNMANALLVSSGPKLTGMVMALATNAPIKGSPRHRKPPTPQQRNEVETLVRTEFRRRGTATFELKAHNLTALDIDNDDKAELVGSYWIAPKIDERRLLFFIAEVGATGKYSLTHSEYDRVTADKIMSGAEMSHVDSGIVHELLLDVIDLDGDGVSEIFTIGKAFEGNNFYVYRKQKGKWVKVFESYNYRCAF